MKYAFNKDDVRRFKGFIRKYCSYGSVLIRISPEVIKMKAFGHIRVEGEVLELDTEIETSVETFDKKELMLYGSANDMVVDLFLSGDIVSLTLYKDTYNDMSKGNPDAVTQELVITTGKGKSYTVMQRTGNHATNSLDVRDVERGYIEY